MRTALLQVFPAREGLSAGEIEQLVDALITILRGLSAMFVVTTLTLNLWLAAKISAVSGRLHRPWPDLKSTALPPMTLVALPVAWPSVSSAERLRILAQIVAAALMMAYALVGLAVLHTVTLLSEEPRRSG